MSYPHYTILSYTIDLLVFNCCFVGKCFNDSYGIDNAYLYRILPRMKKNYDKLEKAMATLAYFTKRGWTVRDKQLTSILLSFLV